MQLNNTQLEPQFALVGYKDNTEYSNDYLVNYHPITDGAMGAGAPLTIDVAGELFKAFNLDAREMTFKGMMPKNIVHVTFGHTPTIIWTVNPSKRYLHFTEELNIESGNYPLPKLLFKLIGNSLSVFALQKSDHINENTILKNAPFLNVSNQGTVCMGNANISVKNIEHFEDAITLAERNFFGSVFTHTNSNTLINGNISEWYAKNLNGKKFDESLLVDSKITLKSIL